MVDGVAFSAGPYSVAGFGPEERLTLVRNNNWWGDAPLLDRITIRTYDSARDQLDALEIGELDLVHVEDARATDAARARGFDGAVVDVNVGVIASVEDGDDLFASRSTGDYDLVIALDVVSTDPIATLFRFGSEYCPTSFAVAGCDSAIATNLNGTSDARLDELLTLTSTEIDPAARAQLFRDVDERLAEIVPSLPLHELPTFAAYDNRLGGVIVDTHRGGLFAGMSGWGFLDPIELS
jgi:ABC-type transport system substrate-binding protein